MKRVAEFMKFLKDKFFRCADGMALAEVLIAGAILGGLSLSVMQMTQNMSKNQKKFQYDTEINEFITRLQMGLRDKTACERTFVGADEPANPGVPLQPITIHANAIPPYTPSVAIVNSIYGGGQNGAGNAMVLARTGQVYGAVGGTFRIEEIKLHSAQTPSSMNELVTARVGIKIRKMGIVNDQGDADPSNDTMKGTWGPAEVVKNFDIMVTVWDGADPSIAAAGGVAGNLRSCFVSEDYYVNAACRSLGGELDTDGTCKNLAIGKLSESYPSETLNNESERWEFLVEGNTRLKNNVEVGYDNGAETNPNAATYTPPLMYPGYPDQGNLLVEHNVFSGYEKTSGSDDIPRMGNNDVETGNFLGTGNLFMGYSFTGRRNPNLPGSSVGNVVTTGSIYSGYRAEEDLNTGGGEIGEIVTTKGLTVNPSGSIDSNRHYGIDIRDQGTSINQFLLKIGDDTGFIDVDIANHLRLAGNSGGSPTDVAHLRLGPNSQNAQLSGTLTGIGINRPIPGARLHVGGNAIIDADLDVNSYARIGPSSELYDLQVDGNAQVLGHLKLSFPAHDSIAGVESDYAATTGWVRRRIAATLATDGTVRNQIASDMMNEVFEEAGSALRVIQRNYCENLRITTTRQTDNYSSSMSGQWSSGGCTYRVKTCSQSSQCNYVYSNFDVLARRDVRASRDVVAVSRVRGGNLYSNSYVYASAHIQALSYVRGSRFCIGGAGNLNNCMTRMPNQMCGAGRKVMGIRRGYVVCGVDIRGV